LDRELEQLPMRISSFNVGERDPEEVDEEQEDSKYKSEGEGQKSLSNIPSIGQPGMSGTYAGTPALVRIAPTTVVAEPPVMEVGHKSMVPEPG